MSLSSLVKQELAILRERYLFATDETLQDPVFDGMVRQLNGFNECLGSILTRVTRLTELMESFTGGLDTLSDTIVKQYTRTVPEDQKIISDCYKIREASNQIGRADGPHSVLSKYKRDLEYNVLGPLRSHMDNCRNLRYLVELRNRRKAELAAAENKDKIKRLFEETDQEAFDWFMILEEYKGDILDSLLQTIKYLEYEFFAASAHSIAASLPARIEFRPLVEMSPKQLQAQLNIEQKARAELEGSLEPGGEYAKRLMGAKESKSSSPQVSVDILSLSSLLAQGFEEGPARKALRECNNDTQAALEFLLSGGRPTATEDDVRIPTTLKRIKRIKELKMKLQQKRTQETDVVDKQKLDIALPSLDDLLPEEHLNLLP
jgi:hypothetical protein